MSGTAPDDVGESALAATLALTHILDFVVLPLLRDQSPERFKRLVDDHAERCERLLSEPPDASWENAAMRAGLTKSLSLLRTAFDAD